MNPYVKHYLDDALQYLGLLDPPANEWRHLAARWQFIGSTDPKDDMYCTFDITNITGGTLDSSWTSGDYTTMETKLDTFFTALASQQSSSVRLVAYKWYVRSFNDMSFEKPFAPHGPPDRVTTKAITGTSGGIILPPQIGISVTEKTIYPRNWGRFYIPGIGGTAVNDPSPTIKTTAVDAIATATSNLVTSMAASDFQLVVPITSLGPGRRGSNDPGVPTRRLSTVDHIQVDNVFDVQRSRRTHAVSYRKVLP